MPRSPSYTVQDVARMKQLLTEGRRVQDIATDLRLTPKVVLSAIRKSEGLGIRQFRAKYCPITYTAKDVESFETLLLHGLSVEQVAEQTGYTAGQIRYAVKHNSGLGVLAFRETHRDHMPLRQLASAGNSPPPTEDGRLALRTLRLPARNTRIGRPLRTHTKTCRFCSKPFETKDVNRVCCSLSCASKTRRAATNRQPRLLVQKHCEKCGTRFSTKRPLQKYCSTACQRACISKTATHLENIPCAYCDTLFRPKQRGTRFCSKECAYKGRNSSSLVFGRFKLAKGSYIRFESSYELVFLLYASRHGDRYRNLRRCDFAIPYVYHDTAHRYYPDFLAENERDHTSLFEIKSSGTAHRDLKLGAKLAAARAWCSQHAMEFVYLTDEDESFVAMCEFAATHHGLDIADQLAARKSMLRIVKHCVECGRRIPRTGTGVTAYLQRRFCSEQCRNVSRHGKRERSPESQHTCPQCKRSFYDPLKTRRFCSKKCYTMSQRTIEQRICLVCGTKFLPKGSSQRTCGTRCGIVLRSATQGRMSVEEYLTMHRHKMPLPERTCSACKKTFVPRSQTTRKCPDCWKATSIAWTLERIIAQLKVIRNHLQGRIPSYSELYHSMEMRDEFHSCGLAGAIHRRNQEEGIGSYAEFVRRHLGWIIPKRVYKRRASVQ